MIELNEKTQQDFLNREWAQKLLDAGVDMFDAKYCLLNIPVDGVYKDYIDLNDFQSGDEEWRKRAMLKIPTYTVSELLYKLCEKQGIYTIFNNLRNNDIDNTPMIESLASLLIQCHKKDIGIARKDTGDISDK